MWKPKVTPFAVHTAFTFVAYLGSDSFPATSFTSAVSVARCHDGDCRVR